MLGAEERGVDARGETIEVDRCEAEIERWLDQGAETELQHLARRARSSEMEVTGQHHDWGRIVGQSGLEVGTIDKVASVSDPGAACDVGESDHREV